MTLNDDLQKIKQRRDGVLNRLVDGIPYARFMGIEFQRHGDELTGIMRFDQKLIGNPLIPALHGGGVAGFLETAAIIGLTWHLIWDDMESGGFAIEDIEKLQPNLPKTIDFTVDYLRPALARDVYARARVNRSGRRYASVHVEAWQDQRARLVAQSTGHFLLSDHVYPKGIGI